MLHRGFFNMQEEEANAMRDAVINCAPPPMDLAPPWSTDEFQLPEVCSAKCPAGAWTTHGSEKRRTAQRANGKEKQCQPKTSRERQALLAACSGTLNKISGPLAVPLTQTAPRGTADSWVVSGHQQQSTTAGS
jgi:hypothetical protein